MNTQETTPSNDTVASNESAPAPRNRTPNYAAGALWASAFLLAALTVVQAGRMPLNAAYGEAATTGLGGTSSATIATGLGPDNKAYEALWIVDNRTEMLSIYYIENANSGEKSLQLRNMQSLPQLFAAARGGT